MQFGATMWFTEYSISPTDLAVALEERGFKSLWASEHSHLPLGGGAGDGKVQADVMDPFLTLTAAAMSTKTLKLGTGICLVNQRDPIQTAKLVATLDQLSNGRLLFGIGNGWHEEEMRNHGTAWPRAISWCASGSKPCELSGRRTGPNTTGNSSISAQWLPIRSPFRSRILRSSSEALIPTLRAELFSMATVGMR